MPMVPDEDALKSGVSTILYFDIFIIAMQTYKEPKACFVPHAVLFAIQ